MILPALSIRQPWAHAILHGGKDVENRTWPLPENRKNTRLLIHAGKRMDVYGLSMLQRLGHSIPDDVPCGGIVGLIEFDGCTKIPVSEWSEAGLFSWRIAKAVPLPFFPCLGRLSFFSVDYPYPIYAISPTKR